MIHISKINAAIIKINLVKYHTTVTGIWSGKRKANRNKTVLAAVTTWTCVQLLLSRFNLTSARQALQYLALWQYSSLGFTLGDMYAMWMT